ncbi:MAG: GGDEF domain-containing protein, partial [Chloroflexota bacterium]
MPDARRPRPKKAAPSPDPSPSTADDLRGRAEERLVEIPAASPAPEDPRDVVHELQVHQVELELQNEELRRTQLELDAERAKYLDLFDLAPVGYLTLTDKNI